MSKTYPTGWFSAHGRSVLTDVTVRVAAGETVALVGPNGAGKSTVLKLIAGLVSPERGTIRVGGVSVPSRQARMLVGFASGDDRGAFAHLTGRQNLELFAALFGADRAACCAELKPLAEALCLRELLDMRVARMSSGMKARIGIARALLGRPRVLLLDEPTKSLDESSTERVYELLRRFATGDNAVVLATHSSRDLEATGARVLRVGDGKVSDAGSTHSGQRAP